MVSRPQIPMLGPVLVVGGCGFLGFHIVRQLLEDPECSSVAVLSRNPNRNCLPTVSYHAGDVANSETVQTLLNQLKPRVIIHTASPLATDETRDASYYKQTNIVGTQNILACAANTPSVVAFLYTSSCSVIAGSEHYFSDENEPLLDVSSKDNPYVVTKAIADALVLAANREPNEKHKLGFHTTCIRIAGIYGERDSQIIPGFLNVLRDGQAIFQLGDNNNLCDWLHVENAALAHICAAKALLAESVGLHPEKVGGEAFLITDDSPLPFWDFARKVWAAAGSEPPRSKTWVIPTRVAIVFAIVLEWIYWIATFGTRGPRDFSRHAVEWSCSTKTFSIGKAKKRLGYVPRYQLDDGVKKAVQWALEEYPQYAVLKKGKAKS